MNIGTRLRHALDAMGLKINEAAEKAGLPYRSMQNYLRGEREPGAEALASISEHLGISVDWLLTGTGTMLRSAEGEGTILSPRDRGLLELFQSLDGEAQREIQSAAEEKKRLKDMERQLKELSLRLDRFNSAG